MERTYAESLVELEKHTDIEKWILLKKFYNTNIIVMIIRINIIYGGNYMKVILKLNIISISLEDVKTIITKDDCF